MSEKVARKVKYLDDVTLEVTFQDGKIIQYDMSELFSDYPWYAELRKNRELFVKGGLSPAGWIIIWNEDIDLGTITIYEHGKVVGYEEPTINDKIGSLINEAMSKKNIYQSELARISGVDQADIWRLLQGKGNPTLKKIDKICKALDIDLQFSYKKRSKFSYKSKATN